jgi:LPS-assembly lipoprotein
LSRLAATFACLLLCACGFQLRGDTATGLKTLYVSAAVPSQVAQEVRRRLSGGPTKIAATVKEGELHLRILSEQTEKLIQTLTGAGVVYDYQLRLKVGYQVTDAAEKVLIEPAQIEVRRVITYSASAPLAKEAEERLLYNDMRTEAAAQILRRIAVVRGQAPR